MRVGKARGRKRGEYEWEEMFCMRGGHEEREEVEEEEEEEGEEGEGEEERGSGKGREEERGSGKGRVKEQEEKEKEEEESIFMTYDGDVHNGILQGKFLLLVVAV